jgi:DNA-binding transcriptional MerR regulator
MAYTVKQLAKLSGISVRTLHFYDEIGLLKPAYLGGNNYRYYEQEQLLMLQQILFYREIGFQLNDIQRVMNSDSFNKLEALQSHKNILKQRLNHTQTMIGTIDKTIAHLRGEITMHDEEFYYGFDSEKQKQNEKYLVDNGILTQEFLDECNKKIKNWSNKEKNAFIKDIERIIGEIIIALSNKLSPFSAEVQDLMQQHYTWLERTWTPTKDSYLGLIDLYKTPEFRKFYDDRHPDLLDFMINAMRIFANKTL